MTNAPSGGLRGPPSKWVPVGLESVIGSGSGLAEPTDPGANGEFAARPDQNIGRLFGRYRIVRPIGRGGMAVVYLAEEQDNPETEVAIKVLTQESALSQATITRFLKEGQAISLIRHPNVIQLVEPPGRTHDGQVYLVMELLTGKPLSEILGEMGEAGQVFTWPRLAPLVLQICRGLQAAHKQKVVHRDMKPSNCFCTELDDEPWHIKVLDFGIAKVQSTITASSQDSIETPLTQDGVFVGTPHYAAPEISERRPDHTIDGRADIFSLGVMMYQCLTGTLPFEEFRRDKLAAIFKTARERPESPRSRAPARDIPVEVDALVMRAMEIDVDRRFASVTDLMAAIRKTVRPGGTFGFDSVPEFSPGGSGSGERTPGASSPAVPLAAGSSGGTPAGASSVVRPATANNNAATTAGATPAAGAVSAAPDPRTPLPPGSTTAAERAEGTTAIQPGMSSAARMSLVIACLMMAGLLAIVVMVMSETFKKPRAPEKPTPARAAK